jgi:hypothetical protein
VDLDPEQRDAGLASGIGQVRSPARAADPEHAVLIDPDDGPDHSALGAFEAGEGVVEVGGAEALLGEQGPGCPASTAGSPDARASAAWRRSPAQPAAGPDPVTGARGPP